MGSTIITLVLLVSCLATLVVGGCPNSKDCCVMRKSCCEVLDYGFKFTTSGPSGVYNITDFCGACKHVVEAYCDADTAGGGWLVVQRREDESARVDFNRDWKDYEDGFGDLNGEFWYGLTPLYCLTNQGQWELRFDFTLTTGGKGYLSYSSFKVGPPSSNYQLSISGYNGTASKDPLTTHNLNGMQFTTKDRDNDKWSRNCAIHYVGNAGGWWYNACSFLQANHVPKYRYGIHDGAWKALSSIEMKIRPKECKLAN